MKDERRTVNRKPQSNRELLFCPECDEQEENCDCEPKRAFYVNEPLFVVFREVDKNPTKYRDKTLNEVLQEVDYQPTKGV